MSGCVFCQIINKESPAKVIHEWNDAIALVPLNPVVDGHVLVIPKDHVADALVNPVITGLTFKRAAELAKGQCNFITSVGEHATQSVYHLHVHIVPRKSGDNLKLPWSGQRIDNGEAPDLIEKIKSHLSQYVGSGVESVWIEEKDGNVNVHIETSDVRNKTLNPIFDIKFEIEDKYDNFDFLLNRVDLDEKKKSNLVWQLL